MSRPAALLLALTAVLGVLAVPAGAAAPACGKQVLVLAAMPLELNPLIREARVDDQLTRDGRTFYVGRLAGVHVVMAMTGIGPANARQTTQVALRSFRCPFHAVVFSGVAGSRRSIGDVAVPRRWTDGRTWTPTDPLMLGVARRLRASQLHLAQSVPVGDAACACPGVDAATPVTMPRPARLFVGGDGTTADPFGGRAVPCVPGGGDIAGCEPCLTVNGIPTNAATFASRAVPLADPGFFAALFTPPAETTSTFDAQDQETAAVAAVSLRARLPFLGVRGVSDGLGDPLHLPGFPAQFAVYRQLAGNNAAEVTVAFLQAWRLRGLPTA